MIRATPFRPFGFEALAYWPLILVHAPREGDAALIAHEKVHMKRQAMWHLPWLVACVIGVTLAPSLWWLAAALVNPWLVLYLAWPTFRFNEEVLGYRAQIDAGGITTAAAAQAISDRYLTGRSYAACLLALTD